VILFFDRSVGVSIPKALREYLNPPDIAAIEYHDLHFEMDEGDDVWLPKVGEHDWFVIGQDHNYHNNSPELEAIRQYGIGAFYLWGAEEHRWETMRCFARGYNNIVRRAAIEPRPFVFKVERAGNLNQVFI